MVRPADLVGSQLATTRVVPRGRTDPDAVALANTLGMTLDPWQAEILTGGSAQTRGRWSAFEVGAIVPRQNGKSYLVVARALAGALLYGERLILYSAHEYRTALETWRTMVDLVTTEPLSRYVAKVTRWGTQETVEFVNGARFKMVARTRSAGRGLSPDCLLLDEAFTLNADVMASLLPSLAARPNPQVWYLSSAGTWEAEVLLALRKRGHSGPSRGLAYWEWHADPECDHRDPRVHAATNPAYGRRLAPSSVDRELASMSRRAFLRERLGVWSESVAETVLEEEDVNALTVDVPGPPMDGRTIGWGADAAFDRSHAAIAAAFHDDDGSAVLVLVDSRAGAGWLPERLGQLALAYDIPGVAFDGRGNVQDLMERASRDHDVTTTPMRHHEFPSACANLAQRVAERSLRFAAAPPLVNDAIGATAYTTPSGWVWQRKTATPPTNLIAATAALHALERDGGSSVAVY